ncbi:MAG: amidohydrolase family protein [Acidimicrobiia bacterium]
MDLPTMQARFAVIADEMFTGNNGEPVVAVGVLVDEGIIVDVDAAATIRRRAKLADADLYEVESPTTLIPGLIDGHVHLGWRGGIDGERQSAASMQAAAGQVLASGVTTVRDCGSPGYDLLRLRDEINAGLFPGPRIIACGPALTTTGGHGEFIGLTADSKDQLRRRVQELAAAGVDAIKVMATGGAMDSHTNRRRAQYSVDELAELVDVAHRLGLPVVAHCNATEGIENAVTAGVDTIAHCNWLGTEEGTIDYRPALADAILRQGISIDLNIEATLAPLSAGDGHAQIWDGRAPANRWELHLELRRRGAAILLTSDEFAGGIARFPHLLAAAVRTAGIPTAEVIYRATSVPAEVLRIADQVGTIASGKTADLVLLKGLLSSDAGAITRIVKVWQAGRPIDL